MKKAIVILWLIAIFNCWLLYRAIDNQSNVYKQGFEAGIKHEKQRRTAWADSIRNSNKWNNGVPDSVRKDFKWE